MFIWPARAREGDALVYASAEWPPFVFTENNQVVAGIEHDIVQEMARRLKLHLVSRSCPWARCLSLLISGQIDITGGLTKTPEREGHILYLEPPLIVQSTMVFYVIGSQPSAIQRYEDLWGKKIGVVRGYIYFERFDHDPNIYRVPAGNEEQLLKMVLTGRVDAAFMNQAIGAYIAHRQGFVERLTTSPFTYTYEATGYYGLSKRSNYASKQKIFHATLAQIVSDGTFEMIKRKYVQVPASSETPTRFQ